MKVNYNAQGTEWKGTSYTEVGAKSLGFFLAMGYSAILLGKY